MGSLVSSVTDAIGLTDVGGTKYAARRAADETRAATQAAAEEMRFRPIGVSTAFGTSRFGLDPKTERLISAGYTLSPEIAALQQRLLGMAPTSLTAAEQAVGRYAPAETAAAGLFNLGGQLIPTSVSRAADPAAIAQAERLSALGTGITPTSYDPTAAAQRYFEQQQALLEPARQREEARLGASVFGRGRGGLFLSDMGQPELYGLSKARAEQDAAIAAAAQERARQELQQDIALGTQLSGLGLDTRVAAENLARERFAQDLGLGTGLFGTGAELYGIAPQAQVQALAPFQTQLGLAQTLEQLGQEPLSLGMQLGGAAQAAGSQVGQTLLSGGLSAAQTRFAGQQAAQNQMSQLLGNLIGGGAQIYGMSRMGTGSLFKE